jgi:hypothetical protein
MVGTINSIGLKSHILGLILVLNLISKIIFITTPFEHIDSAAFPDDSYISLHLAESIANGNGPSCSTGYTNGFQPLYVFLCVPFYLLFDDKIKPVYAALIMLMLFDCLSLIMVLKTINLFTKSKYPLIIASVFWITSPYVLLTTMNGLETIISFFFIVSSLYYFFRNRNELNDGKVRQLIFLGMLSGLAVITRIDNGILAAVILMFIISGQIKNKRSFYMTAVSAVLFTVFVFITVFPWMLYSYLYTGEIIQSSAEAVRYQNWSLKNYFNFFSAGQLEMILYGLRILIIKNTALIISSALCMIFIIIRFQKNKVDHIKKMFTELHPLMMFCFILFCAYIFYIYGMWFFKRYFFPFELLFILTLALLSDTAVSSLHGEKSRRNFVIFISAIVVVINFTRYDFREAYVDFNDDKSNSGYLPIGEWVSQNFKNGTVIGSMQSGAMSYFAGNIEVVNLDGVVNADALTAIKNKNLIGYVKKMHIEYIVGWEINNEYLIRESEEFNKDDLTKVLTITDFKTWGREWSLYKVNYAK